MVNFLTGCSTEAAAVAMQRRLVVTHPLLPVEELDCAVKQKLASPDVCSAAAVATTVVATMLRS